MLDLPYSCARNLIRLADELAAAGVALAAAVLVAHVVDRGHWGEVQIHIARSARPSVVFPGSSPSGPPTAAGSPGALERALRALRRGVSSLLVRELTEGRVPVLGVVREAVRREWANAHRIEANERLYQEMLKRYSVIIERPQPVPDQEKLAAAQR